MTKTTATVFVKRASRMNGKDIARCVIPHVGRVVPEVSEFDQTELDF